MTADDESPSIDRKSSGMAQGAAVKWTTADDKPTADGEPPGMYGNPSGTA
jgi:hypothetical protein